MRLPDYVQLAAPSRGRVPAGFNANNKSKSKTALMQ
jgi:hypothetical protein